MTDLPLDGTEWKLTFHAKDRMVERRLNPDAVKVVCRHADLRPADCDGLVRARISRRVAKRLDRERAYLRRTIEDARETEVVLLPNIQVVVTAWRTPVDERFRRSGARPRNQRRWRKVEE